MNLQRDQDAQGETHVVRQVTNVQTGRETATLIQTAKLAWCVGTITAFTITALTAWVQTLTGTMTAAKNQARNPIYIFYSKHNLLYLMLGYLIHES